MQTGKFEVQDGRFDRGSNQSGLRAFNERLLLSVLRRHGAMAKAEIAQLTGLSAQTVSVIMRKLENDGLLQRGEPSRVRGKVGQPSVPMSLNPDGAYFLGLKLGRRSSNLVLIDFLGRRIDEVKQSYSYPTPDTALEFTRDAVSRITRRLPRAQRDKVAGLGICMPYRLWEWVESTGAPSEIMTEWQTCDLRAQVAALFDFPVYLQNDATAACGAELVFGQNAASLDFLYFYIGYFVGGGVVLGGSLYNGKTGNAGALGSMPVLGNDGTMHQLIELASIASLEESLAATGEDSSSLWEADSEWTVNEALLDAWTDSAGRAIAQAIVSAVAVIDFETALIDGWLPATIRSAVVAATRRHLRGLNARGIELPTVGEGSVGRNARELGAASLPLSSRFLLDQNALHDRN